jgi:CheY-like chemotaxis protein/HPt (histidine-containing phosphotransfer) domain-containing protein
MNVLIVTSHTAYEEILPAYLQAAGIQITVVGSEEAALHAIHQSAEEDRVVLIDLTHESAINAEISKLVKKTAPALPVVRLVSRRISSTSGSEFSVMANPLLLDDLVHTLALASRRFAAADIVQKTERRSRSRKMAPTVEEALATGQLILVAEDNETSREVIQEQLRILGYASEAAEDGSVALEKWRSGRYSMLLTDCHMPILDGFGLTAAIRKEEIVAKRIPIIAVTGNAMMGEAQRCLAKGMDDYLAKPLRLSDLGAKLARWLPQQCDMPPDTAPEARLSDISTEVPAAEVVWDAGTLTRMVGDQPEMHRRLLDKFLLNSEEHVAAIVSAVAAGDLDTVAGVAHKMKSAARTVGALQLGALCQVLETSGRAGDIDAVNPRSAELEVALQDVRGQMRDRYN